MCYFTLLTNFELFVTGIPTLQYYLLESTVTHAILVPVPVYTVLKALIPEPFEVYGTGMSRDFRPPIFVHESSADLL